MRQIDVRFWVPGSDEDHRKLELLSLVRSEAELRFATHAAHGLPSREVLNRVFSKGRGDDGFIPMTWDPFLIDESEYAELSEAFRKC